MARIRNFLMMALLGLSLALQGCPAAIMMAGALPVGAAGAGLGVLEGAKLWADKKAAYGYGTTVGGDINRAHSITKSALKKLGAESKMEKGGLIRAFLRGQEIIIEVKPGLSATEVLVFSNDKALALEVAEAIEKIAEAA